MDVNSSRTARIGNSREDSNIQQGHELQEITTRKISNSSRGNWNTTEENRIRETRNSRNVKNSSVNSSVNSNANSTGQTLKLHELLRKFAKKLSERRKIVKKDTQRVKKGRAAALKFICENDNKFNKNILLIILVEYLSTCYTED
jgi:hypothetical protein